MKGYGMNDLHKTLNNCKEEELIQERFGNLKNLEEELIKEERINKKPAERGFWQSPLWQNYKNKETQND